MTKSRFQLGRRGFLQALTSGLAFIGCERPGYSETIPHLFACGEGDLSVLARKALGRKLDRDDIFRNSTGSRVYLTAAYTNREILVLSANQPPRIIVAPARGWVISDDLTFVAWVDDAKRRLNFRSGFHQEVPLFTKFDFTPGAQFYFIANDNITVLYETAKPGVPLAEVRFTARKIFHKNGLIYLFGSDYQAKENSEILGCVFWQTAGVWRVETDVHIPRPIPAASPFAVVDLDLLSDRVLCVDIRDEFGAKWFIYDLHSRSLTDIRTFHTYGLFLQQDLMKSLGMPAVDDGVSRRIG